MAASTLAVATEFKEYIMSYYAMAWLQFALSSTGEETW
jgi:hypothetical protein